MKRRQRSFSKVRFMLLMMTVIVLLGGIYYAVSSDSHLFFKSTVATINPESEADSKSDSDAVSPTFENDSSQVKLSTQELSYILINPQTGEVLQSHNSELQRAPASTLKLITGLIAIESLEKTDMVKVGSEVNLEGSRLGLNPGDEISVHDLLTALYVNSSNDAAAALAVKISGSIPAFAQKTNEYASKLGCLNTHFTTPHGLPDANQYTTAKDLSKIAGEFIKNQELMEYVGLSNATVRWKDAQGVSREAKVFNTNRLLNTYPGDQGLKTGTTTAAGQCLVSYVSRSDGDFLLVLLGSKQRYEDTINILDEAWAEQRPKAALKELTKDPNSLILSPGIF